MIKQNEFKSNHYKYLLKVINNKDKGERKDILKFLRIYLKERYIDYQQNKSNLEDIPNTILDITVPKTEINEKYSLIHMYDSQETYAKEYLKDIKDMLKAGIICPYCGISDVKEIDHFLPKSKFPEFSLYLPNMVISCSDCNGEKDNIAIDTKSKKRFVINPYHDTEILDINFLVCKILPPYDAPKFNIDFSDLLSPKNKGICFEHIKTVSIEDKVIGLWRNYFNELSRRLEKTYVKKFIGLDRDIIKSKFINIIDDEIDTKNIEDNIVHNSLFLSYKLNDDLLDFIIEKFDNKYVVGMKTEYFT